MDAQATPLGKCIDRENGNRVVIGEGAPTGCTGTVSIDADQNVGKITIKSGGALVLNAATADRFPKLSLTTTGIDITQGGSMLIGCPDHPIGSGNPAVKFTIFFTGSKPNNCGTPNNQPASMCPGSDKGIQVAEGGTLRMYGVKGVPPSGVNWTYLSQPAGPAKYNPTDTKSYIKDVKAPVTSPGDEIHLAADVTQGAGAWRQGDWIAIATTSFSPWETEFVKIRSLHKEGGGTKITLDQPLQFYHFGGPDPNIDPSANYGIDERAEVGLISRNILLTSDADTSDGTTHWGGEIRFLHGFKAVSIQGVELQKFGKEQLGAYPIHFHMDGDLANYKPADKLIDSNSIDHSYNKCITVHDTQDLTISNNVCARITGSIFYEELGNEYNITFDHNLGMGAMSNSFDVNAKTSGERDNLINTYYWPGDNMAPDRNSFPDAMTEQDIAFDQIGIFDTDNQTNPVRGSCGSIHANGGLYLDRNNLLPKCDPGNGNVYFEPPSGFWITNPSAKLSGNAIAGCQDVGKAYWYVPPASGADKNVQYIPIGAQYSGYTDRKQYGLFDNNRGSGCYSGLYDEGDGVVNSEQLKGFQNGKFDDAHQAVVDEFNHVTFSRIRDRGIWLRPTFYVIDNARIATSRDGVSLVTSGGVDGNFPGVWGLLENSVIAGISDNNVDRWGPCGAKIPATGKQLRGAQWGCIDQTDPDGGPATGGELVDSRGYPTPDWPLYGFLIYDGPPIMLKDKFVNFRVAPGSTAPPNTGFTAANLLTGSDDDVLKNWIFYGIPGCPTPPKAYTVYEGDAALGWFNANQSSYPAATATKELTFENVDLRHQIYTAAVNRGEFTDGDENTTILDFDGTLSGVTAIDKLTKEPLPSISLNNLGINASANSVDECLSEGAEDLLREGRPTGAMVPSALGQLEFEMLYPPIPGKPNEGDGHTQLLTFTKNTTDFSGLGTPLHESMPLKSRNGLGDWEPKVTNGYGYTVTAGYYTSPGLACKELPRDENTPPGFNGTMDVTLTDIVNDPEINQQHPFYVQLGICLTNANGTHPKDGFTITRGYRSYGSQAGLTTVNDELKKYYSGQLKCNNLDAQMAVADGKPNTMPSTCPAKSATGKGVVTLTPVSQYSALTTNGNPNGKPNLDKYYYDSTNGWLFMWVAQTEPNASGPSPLGNCTGKPDEPSYCPKKTTGESYYVCPAEGCTTYRLQVLDSNYSPGPSQCGDPYKEGYNWPEPPTDENTLVLAGTSTAVVRKTEGGLGGKFPHYAATPPISCPVATPTPVAPPAP